MIKITDQFTSPSKPLDDSTGTAGWFRNMGVGIQPTHLTAEWFNTVQAELENVRINEGLQGDYDSDSQIMTAIRNAYNPNPIINGHMRIAERGTSFAAPANGTYTLDRWALYKSGTSAGTVAQTTEIPPADYPFLPGDVPVKAGFRFTNSLKHTVTTASGALAASNFYQIAQVIEGCNVGALLAHGGILSFWVKASKAGDMCVALTSPDNLLSFVSSIQIPSADVWQRATVTIPPPATLTNFNFDEGTRGVYVGFILNSGSDYETSTLDNWVSGAKLSSTTQTNFCSTIGDSVNITGVSISAGQLPTPTRFVQDDYSMELIQCKRYYQAITLSSSISTYGAAGAGVILFNSLLPVKMKSGATVTMTNGALTNTSAVSATVTQDNVRISATATALGNVTAASPVVVRITSEL